MNLDFAFLQVSPPVAVLVAAAVGGALGWVGPFNRRALGLAVHGLLAAAAALYAQQAGSTYALALPPVEPNHVMAIVIAAVCLLGAATTFRLFRSGLARSLASSASLLFTALTGLLAGSGEVPLALGAAAVALAALAAPELPPVERVLRRARAVAPVAPVNVTVPNNSLRLPSRP